MSLDKLSFEKISHLESTWKWIDKLSLVEVDELSTKLDDVFVYEFCKKKANLLFESVVNKCRNEFIELYNFLSDREKNFLRNASFYPYFTTNIEGKYEEETLSFEEIMNLTLEDFYDSSDFIWKSINQLDLIKFDIMGAKWVNLFLDDVKSIYQNQANIFYRQILDSLVENLEESFNSPVFAARKPLHRRCKPDKRPSEARETAGSPLG